jgi:hypothetical protein
VKVLAWSIGVVSVAGTGGYVIVYLVRWEWHRALIAGVLFLAAEVAVATAVVLHSVRAGRKPGDAPTQDRLLEHIERSRPRRDHFAWLRRIARLPGSGVPELLDRRGPDGEVAQQRLLRIGAGLVHEVGGCHGSGARTTRTGERAKIAHHAAARRWGRWYVHRRVQGTASDSSGKPSRPRITPIRAIRIRPHLLVAWPRGTPAARG